MGIAAGLSSNIASVAQTAGPGSPTAALEAQLQRCNQQLGDWVNCESGKTPAGKKIIQSLETRIGKLKSRIAEADNKTGVRPDQAQSKPADPNAGSQRNGAGIGLVGTLVNVFA